MFASKNGPDISHLFLIVDHLGHIFSQNVECRQTKPELSQIIVQEPRGVCVQKWLDISHLFLIVDHLGHIFSEGGHSETRQ